MYKCPSKVQHIANSLFEMKKHTCYEPPASFPSLSVLRERIASRASIYHWVVSAHSPFSLTFSTLRQGLTEFWGWLWTSNIAQVDHEILIMLLHLPEKLRFHHCDTHQAISWGSIIRRSQTSEPIVWLGQNTFCASLFLFKSLSLIGPQPSFIKWFLSVSFAFSDVFTSLSYKINPPPSLDLSKAFLSWCSPSGHCFKSIYILAGPKLTYASTSKQTHSCLYSGM